MDEQYIKMILALPEEFFKEWKWKEGDPILINNKIGGLFLWSTENYIWYYNNEPSFYPHYIKEACATIKKDENINPIPSPEQLQKISGLDWWTFYSAIVHKSDISYEQNEPVECACLRQAVWILYGKKWNGEKWI